MGRFFKWDYRLPYFYMVTLKCLRGKKPLSRLDKNDPYGLDINYTLTRELHKTIEVFLSKSPGLDSVTPYIIMPDHLHLLLKMNENPERVSLPRVVTILKHMLTRTYREQTGEEGDLFEKEWHDLIVKKQGQLKNFKQYIKNNPKMAILRQTARDKFHCYRNFKHWRLGEGTCDLVGNPELLEEPAFLAVRLSRSLKPNTPEWQKEEEFYSRWREGGTAVGTWWSPAEKMAYRRIIENGGNIIFMVPDGFGERWHPTGEEAQRLCAEGRLLFLSPYPPHTAKLPIGETRARCLALNALAKEMAER